MKEKKKLPGPKKPDEIRLSKTARFRLTESEFLKLEKMAESEGLTVADFCRTGLMKLKPKQKKTTPERLALIAGLGNLGNIRADLNQLLKEQRSSYSLIKSERILHTFALIEFMADTIQNELHNGDR